MNERWELLLMDAARASDEETVMLQKSKMTGANMSPPTTILPSVTGAGSPKGQAGTGDEYVVVATYEGRWIPADGSK